MIDDGAGIAWFAHLANVVPGDAVVLGQFEHSAVPQVESAVSAVSVWTGSQRHARGSLRPLVLYTLLFIDLLFVDLFVVGLFFVELLFVDLL